MRVLLKVKRSPSLNGATIGKMDIIIDDGPAIVLYTLEDQVREIVGLPVEQWKVAKRTAIPAGRYKVEMTYSNRFQRMLPQVQDVPGFTGVRIHSGNTQYDTEGCLLAGLSHTGDTVYNSRLAVQLLIPVIETSEESWLEIS